MLFWFGFPPLYSISNTVVVRAHLFLRARYLLMDFRNVMYQYVIKQASGSRTSTVGKISVDTFSACFRPTSLGPGQSGSSNDQIQTPAIRLSIYVLGQPLPPRYPNPRRPLGSFTRIHGQKTQALQTPTSAYFSFSLWLPLLPRLPRLRLNHFHRRPRST
jgi:hypothetical protein